MPKRMCVPFLLTFLSSQNSKDMTIPIEITRECWASKGLSPWFLKKIKTRVKTWRRERGIRDLRNWEDNF